MYIDECRIFQRDEGRDTRHYGSESTSKHWGLVGIHGVKPPETPSYIEWKDSFFDGK